jgi:hypothetical protein
VFIIRRDFRLAIIGEYWYPVYSPRAKMLPTNKQRLHFLLSAVLLKLASILPASPLNCGRHSRGHSEKNFTFKRK